MTKRDRAELLTLKADFLASKLAAAEAAARARGDRRLLSLVAEGKSIAKDVVRHIDRQRSEIGLATDYALYDRRLF